MKNVEILLTNPLLSKQYSADRLANFGNNFAENLAADFPQWAALVKPKAEALVLELGQRNLAQTEQVTETSAVDDFIEEIPRVLSSARARVSVDLGGEQSPGYKALYPNGMATYNNLTKTSAPIVLKALQEAIDKHGTALESDTKARLYGLYTQWENLRGKQERNKSDNDTERSEVRIARDELAWTIWEVLHQLALHFKREVHNAQRFINAELLEAARHASLEREEPASMN